MGTFGQPISLALRDRIAARVDEGRRRGGGYPPDALAEVDAVLVYETSAMFAYYLGDDGAAYELDLDSSRSAEVVTSVSTTREVYEQAIEKWPELVELRDVELVDRVAPDVGLLQGFDSGVGLWNEQAEPREVAITRCTRYFAQRIEGEGPAYVVQRLPSPPNGTFLTLELAGFEPPFELELHVAWRGARHVELVHRGSRAEIVAWLRAADCASIVIALEQVVLR